MTLPKTLQEMMDEAMKSELVSYASEDEKLAFKAAWGACLKALMEMGAEFPMSD